MIKSAVQLRDQKREIIIMLPYPGFANTEHGEHLSPQFLISSASHTLLQSPLLSRPHGMPQYGATIFGHYVTQQSVIIIIMIIIIIIIIIITIIIIIIIIIILFIDSFQSRDDTAMLVHKTIAIYGSCFAL